MNLFLAADIGGTNSRFALFSNEKNKLVLEGELWEKTNTVDSFVNLLERTKEIDKRYDVEKCCKAVIAVPGAVTSEDSILLPYVRWAINKIELKKNYPNTDIVIINDFVAQAYGCLTEAISDAFPLIIGKGQRHSQCDIAIVGAGTGTGHGTLKKLAGSSSYLSIPSEAGHIPFPFLTEEDIEVRLKKFLVVEKKIASPICNDVVSGPGLSRLHQFITGKELSPSEAVKELTPESETTKYFARFYGRACRNYVLSTLASGGKLFISGGVTIKNPFLVDNDNFKSEFLKSETTAKDLLAQLSVFLVRNEKIGLVGAGYYAANVAAYEDK